MHEEVKDILLDKEQLNFVNDTSKILLVIAGAGSGKSTTIIEKVSNIKNTYLSKKILCISFTNDSCISLKNKLINKGINDVEVLTFHKLALKILKKNKLNYLIVDSSLLDFIVNEYFDSIILYEESYMKIVLKYLGILYSNSNIRNYYIKYVLNTNMLKNLKKDITMFIKVFKSNGFNNDYLVDLCKKSNNIFKRKDLYLLYLCIRILYEYNKELESNGYIDFDDMIIKALELIKKKNCLNYDYIIIDEFQDTSLIRYKLVLELINKTNASLIAVGDDYQSIYRFNGCDISLFINFSNYFKDAKVLKIQNTYRNSKELITVASKFIRKNKNQIYKDLKSNISLDKPIKIVYYNNQKDAFIKLIDYLYLNNERNILLLARNNNDILDVLDNNFILKDNGYIIYNKYKDLNLRFLSVHKSKGLEDECVIILSLVDKVWGFPNKVDDNGILKYVLAKKENYKYAEERRLFYVAITRTKKYVYLLTNKKNPSIFVKEILKDSPKYIEIIDLPLQ